MSEEQPGRTPPRQFLREVRAELKRVVWPSGQQIVSYSVVVLVLTLVLGALVYGMDEGIRRLVISTLG
jgi:preprotein translocase subunit SecE